MTKILSETQERGALWFNSKSGSDRFAVEVPQGEVFHSARLTILSSVLVADAKITSQPAVWQTGNAEVVVKWKCDPNAMVRYQIEAFSEPVGGIPAGEPPVTSQMTNFLPSRDGFHFVNAFPQVPQKRIKTIFGEIAIGDASKGLCGGMVFAALDYFNAGLEIPQVSTPPGEGVLFDYIVDRLLVSFDIPAGILNYIELMNPRYPDGLVSGTFGLRPHGRSWRMIRQEWPLIKAKLDAGQLCPIGLVTVKSADLLMLGHNHQVMAYGYDLVGSDLTLRIYDPNTLDDDNVTLKLNISDSKHAVTPQYSAGLAVNCFFATNYSFSKPPGEEPLQGRILLFDGRNFSGKIKDIQDAHPDLSTFKDASFDDKTSAFVILSGNWSFYHGPRFEVPFMKNGGPMVLGPGRYAWVEDVGIKDNEISSLQVVTDAPNF